MISVLNEMVDFMPWQLCSSGERSRYPLFWRLCGSPRGYEYCVEKKSSCRCRESNPDYTFVQLVAWPPCQNYNDPLEFDERKRGNVVPMINFTLCKEHIWGSGGIAPSVLTSALDWGEWSAFCSGPFTPVEMAPSTRWIEDWVLPRAGLDAVGKIKN
jgi:hypothetical protein